MTKIKICGLRREEDIRIVNRYLPDYCGFIINFPKSHRNLAPDEARRLAADVDRNHIKTVGVFVDEPAENVAALLNDGSLDLVQLHGNEDEAYILKLRYLTGGAKDRIIKAFAVKDTESLRAAAACTADYILLDQGKGSGITFDWSVLCGKEAAEVFCGNGSQDGGRYDSERLKNRWFLAGGLGEDNIRAAIERFKPYAIDLSSAVETDGYKDEDKIRRVIGIVREC